MHCNLASMLLATNDSVSTTDQIFTCALGPCRKIGLGNFTRKNLGQLTYPSQQLYVLIALPVTSGVSLGGQKYASWLSVMKLNIIYFPDQSDWCQYTLYRPQFSQ